jgi:hypothetical protein
LELALDPAIYCRSLRSYSLSHFSSPDSAPDSELRHSQLNIYICLSWLCLNSESGALPICAWSSWATRGIKYLPPILLVFQTKWGNSSIKFSLIKIAYYPYNICVVYYLIDNILTQLRIQKVWQDLEWKFPNPSFPSHIFS